MTDWTSAKDPLSNVPSRIDYLGATSVAGQIPLFGDSCHGIVVDDEARWTVAVTVNGTATVGGGELLLSAPDTGDQVSITSIPSFPLLGSGDLVLSATLRISGAPEIGNTRRFGLWAGVDNYMMFVLEDTLWCCRVWEGGQEFANDQTITAPLISATTYMNLQIRASKSRVMFFADDALVGSFTSRGKQLPLSALGLFHVVADNINESPADASNHIYINEVNLVRSFETWPGPPLSALCSSSTETLVARGPVFYCGMVPLGLDQTISVYDGLTASGGTLIHQHDASMTAAHVNPPGPVLCNEGLVVDTAGNAAFAYYVLI